MRGPVRGPSHLCKQCNRGHQRHVSVVSVQLARTVHRAVLLIIRRSWVRAPPAPPAVSLEGPAHSWTGSYRWSGVPAGSRPKDSTITKSDSRRILAHEGIRRDRPAHGPRDPAAEDM